MRPSNHFSKAGRLQNPMSPLLHDGEGAGDEEKSVVLTTSPRPAFGHLLLRRTLVILWIYFEFNMRI